QQNERKRIIVCSLEADKEGHTLTAASNVLFLECPWTPSDVDQATDRAHRIGQKDSVTGWVALARQTIAQDIYELVEEKRGVVEPATDGGPQRVQLSVVHQLKQRLRKKLEQ